MARKVGAIVFDQDGLMFDTERLVLRGWEIVAAKHNTTFGEDFSRDLRGTKPDKAKEAFIRQYGPDIDFDSICGGKRLYSYHWVKKKRGAGQAGA